MPQDQYREFFTLGFFAIIRRVSRAHDAEVRPHVNPKKRKRNAIDAFEKKINEMISTMTSWNAVTNPGVLSHSTICNNSNYSNVNRLIAELSTQYARNRVTYRSTAYGMGRYAYRHRADYTDKENGKQDAIIFFKKPEITK